MSKANLHSIFTSGWMIDHAYGMAQLPLLISLLNSDITSIDTPGASKKDAASIHEIKAQGEGSNSQKENYIAVYSLKSPIYKYNQSCGPSGTRSMMNRLDEFAADGNCLGVVLDIDSGGGQVAGTPEAYDYLSNYSKPIVTYTDGMLASAAYYLASGTDKIFANKRADAIGSIGTMIAFLDVAPMYEKKGAKLIKAYATKSKDKNREYEELIAGKPENYVKNVLDPITETFHQDVLNKRSNLNKDVLTGSTYDPVKALELGLIDQIGTLKDAIDEVVKLSQSSTINNSTNKQENMSKAAVLSLVAIEAVIGSTFSEDETKEGIFLTDEQAQLVNDALANNADQVSGLENQLTDSNQQLDEANTSLNNLSASITSALTKAEVEGATKLSPSQGVEKLSALVEEYGSDDGGSHTAQKGADQEEESNSNVVGGMDISAALNN